MIPVKFHSEAEAELTGAALFYEERVVGLGILFAAEIKKSIECIQTYPEASPRLGRLLRNSWSNDFLTPLFIAVKHKVF